MTENNSGVRQKKVMSKKNQVLRHGRKEVEVGTLLLGNDKNSVIVNYYLFCIQAFETKWLSKAKDK